MITFYEYEDSEKKVFSKNLNKFSLIFFNRPIGKNPKDTEVLVIFIRSKINAKILDKMPSLKLIVTRSTGYDHIDLKECVKRNITVCNIPTYGEKTVAEHTFALLLAISRKIIDSNKKKTFRTSHLRGFDLNKKTLGLIGCGNIGQHVAKMAFGFDMDVVVYDIKQDKKLAKDIGFRYVPLEKVLKSDIISIHVPLNNHTKHLVNRKMFKNMNNGVVLINTSRGEIIDTKALLSSLKSKKIAYAGLDVLERSSLNPQLFKLNNVIITPHNAFNSIEALERINNTTIQNILKFYKNKPINTIKWQH